MDMLQGRDVHVERGRRPQGEAAGRKLVRPRFGEPVVEDDASAFERQAASRFEENGERFRRPQDALQDMESIVQMLVEEVEMADGLAGDVAHRIAGQLGLGAEAERRSATLPAPARQVSRGMGLQLTPVCETPVPAAA